MSRLVSALFMAMVAAGGLAAQTPAAPVAPRAISAASTPRTPRPPRAPRAGRFFSHWNHGREAPLMDSVKAVGFFAVLSQTPVAVCEMAVDNMGNGWGWAGGSFAPSALRDQSASAREDREVYGGARISVNAVGVVSAALARPDACGRRAAARLLGQSELPAASKALRDAARHSDGRVREAALLGIGIREDSANYPAAVQGLSDRDPEVVRMAAWAVGEYERAESVSLLLPLLRRPEVGIRVAAASALGDLEDPAAAPGLAALLKDESVEVRRAAAEALGRR